MPKFRYQALNEKGASAPGFITAKDKLVAVERIRNRGFFPLSITRCYRKRKTKKQANRS